MGSPLRATILPLTSARAQYIPTQVLSNVIKALPEDIKSTEAMDTNYWVGLSRKEGDGKGPLTLEEARKRFPNYSKIHTVTEDERRRSEAKRYARMIGGPHMSDVTDKGLSKTAYRKQESIKEIVGQLKNYITILLTGFTVGVLFAYAANVKGKSIQIIASFGAIGFGIGVLLDSFLLVAMAYKNSIEQEWGERREKAAIKRMRRKH